MGALTVVILNYKIVIKANDCISPMRLYVSVSDRSDKFVQHLQATDFKVVEKKRLQKISQFTFQRNEPISLGVLVDISRDMQEKKFI